MMHYPTTMKSVLDSFRYAWHSRRAWWFTATARTRARYARTTLGSFWLGLSNLLSIAVLGIVYGTVFKVQNFNHYIVFLGTGLVVWNSMASAIGSAPSLLEINAGHIRNTNLHPIYYTLEEWAFQIQTFFQSFILVILVLTYFQHSLILNLILHGWLPMVNLLIFMYWMPLIVCLLGARYRDLYQLVPIFLQLVFLLSPILYEKSNLGHLAWAADYNPFYRVLSPVRHALITGEGNIQQSLVVLCLNATGLAIGILLMTRERKNLPFLV